MAVTITIDDTHHTFEYIDAQDDTTITGAVDIYVTEGFDVAGAMELITSNGNFYIQDTAIEDFNVSGGTVTLGTGDMVIHHTNAGAEAYDFTFNGVISCDEFWFRKATDGATKGCIITFLATLAPILAAGKRVILENRMPTLDFIIDMNGFDIQVGVV